MVEDKVSKSLVLLGILLVAMPASMLMLPEIFASDEQIQEPSGHAAERAIQIARAFIVEAPTFSFDGIPETLRLVDFYVIESFPEQNPLLLKEEEAPPFQYVITFLFESRAAGYGDRTGQVLAQVITLHSARVTVVEDEVVSAILDGQWDELKQEAIPEAIP
ncbi:MAG: hypothetical protein ACE5KH_01510 [Candidatus Geothermarchaeales archaeon]